MTRFVKDDRRDCKVRLELQPRVALAELGNVLTHGAAKYEPDNWRNCTDAQAYIGAIDRHLTAFVCGEQFDPDSGCHHLAALMANAAFLLEQILTKKIDPTTVGTPEQMDALHEVQRRTGLAVGLGLKAKHSRGHHEG